MRRAVVLGASRGVGAHMARRLAEQGWEVTGTGRRPVHDTGLADAVHYVTVNLSEAQALDALGELLAERRPQLIVHNTATYGTVDNPLPTLPQLDEVFRVNATLPYRLLLQYLIDLPTEEFCSCIVVNSDSIYHANETSGVYAASKAALRVLTTALAAACRTRKASVSTLLLGPLADDRKVGELHQIAVRRGVGDEEITRAFLRRSNPALVTESLIPLESCFRSVEYIVNLGRAANGMLCRLDCGSSGSLV